MKRKLVIGLVAAGLFLAGFGGAVAARVRRAAPLPPEARQRHAASRGPASRAARRARSRSPACRSPSSASRTSAPSCSRSRRPPTPAPRRAHDARARRRPRSTTPAQPKPPRRRAVDAAEPAPKSSAPTRPKPEKKASAGADRRRRDPAARRAGTRRPSLKRRLRLPRRRRSDDQGQAGQEGHDADEPTTTPTPAPATHTPPAPSNPTSRSRRPGAAAVGVPNFFIDKFRIPPFLLPIYQAAGIQYGIRWEILAAINEIETDYGRNLNVSSRRRRSAGCSSCPRRWKLYGVDANRDGKRDPYNPVDAIFATARYLKAAGAERTSTRAIFAYNHADWYVDSVLMRARLIGGLPADLVGSLTGLTQGHFPVHAEARYADGLAEPRPASASSRRNAAAPVESSATRRGIRHLREGRLPGRRRPGRPDRQHRRRPSASASFVQLRDVYGNTYTYGHLKKLARALPGAQGRSGQPGRRSPGARAARSATRSRPRPPAPASRRPAKAARSPPGAEQHGRRRRPLGQGAPVRQPGPPDARTSSGGEEQLLAAARRLPGGSTLQSLLHRSSTA